MAEDKREVYLDADTTANVSVSTDCVVLNVVDDEVESNRCYWIHPVCALRLAEALIAAATRVSPGLVVIDANAKRTPEGT